MWYPSLRICRWPLRWHDVEASIFVSFVPPLRALGFRPYGRVVVIQTGNCCCTGAFVFRRRDGGRLCLYFSRTGPLRFHYHAARGVHRSARYHTIEPFEAAVARFFRIPNFTPEKRPVYDWPPRRASRQES